MLRDLLARYPNLPSLARARARDVERTLRPLGLHRMRARALVAAARAIVQRFAGEVPRLEGDLLTLPHVGRYAANAVLCFAHRQRRAVIDANVARVYHRVFGTPVPVEIHKADALWRFADAMLPRRGARGFNWALLDLGGLICTARRPRCGECPLAQSCAAHIGGTCGCGAAPPGGRNPGVGQASRGVR